jgi:dihydrofolate synthase/folylpolyglutamate synthase
MGSPERESRGPLIGGTNGKGSAQAIVAACLAAGGYRVGQTPKPHLVSYRERIVIDGRPIAPTDFAGLVAEVLEVADHVAPRLGPPTEFEVLTVAALTWFVRRDVDVAVVEVGLGGRLDATNAWDGGVAAITNVDFDHMAQLGPTLTAIGREKAAIIKPGDLAVTAADGEGLAVIRRRARRLRVSLDEVTPPTVLAMDRHGLQLRDPELGELRLALVGRHQAANAGLAFGVLRALDRAGIASVTPEAIRAGCAAVRWPGRMELMRPRGGPGQGVEVLLDGAHNAAGAAALAAALDEIRPSLAPGRPSLLLAMMADKEVAKVVAALAGSATLREARVVSTAVDVPRALDPATLAAAWSGGPADREPASMGGDRGRHGGGSVDVEAVLGCAVALERALELARAAGGPLIVAGSLYLVGEVRGRLLRPERP